MCKIAICDDDKEYREKIKTVIETEGILSSNEIRFYEYESGKELLEDADILHDLIFMDMRMPGLDGNKTVLKLREYNEAAILVFCSGCFEPTPDSINVGQPFRYIMKDLHDRSLKKEIPMILLKVKLCCGDSSVTVTSAGRIMRIHTEDILYICLAKRGCTIYIARQGKIEEMHCKESLSDLYKCLAGRGFEYAHNSYIVNLAKVEGLEKNVALLPFGIQLNVSRSRKGQFLLMTNIFIFTVFDRFVEKSEEVKKMDRLYQKSRAEIANLQYTNKVNEDNRAFLHDINKFICTVAGLIEEGENQEVKDIMEHLGVRIQNLQKSVYCEHPILNSILCERKFLAESKDISYRITLGNDLRLDFLEELDLISIVGNLLDNALEAAEKTEDGRYVECRMYMGNAGHFLVMEFCNGYVVPLLKDKDRYISTKRDADSHGIGLHTVGKLVKKYAGIMRVEAGEREFSVKLIFTIK